MTACMEIKQSARTVRPRFRGPISLPADRIRNRRRGRLHEAIVANAPNRPTCLTKAWASTEYDVLR
jgi:hypothetical protein